MVRGHAWRGHGGVPTTIIPDLSPLDYHLWSSIQGVLPDKIPNVGDLRIKLMKAYNEVKVSDKAAFQSNWKTYYKRLEACIAAGGGHFEA